MPTPFAYLVLFGFPLVALWLFRRFGLMGGVIWTVLLGYLLLPLKPAIDLPVPGLPIIDKDFVPAFCAMLLALQTAKRRAEAQRKAQRRARDQARAQALAQPRSRGQLPASQLARTGGDSAASPAAVSPTAVSRAGAATAGNPGAGNPGARGRWLVNALIALALLGPVLTTMTNGEPLLRGERLQLGFQLYDSGRAIITVLVALLPFLLARRYLATPEAHRALLFAFAAAGLGYALLALYEIRMAPVLNRNIYGFFPHDWRQHLRRGGYRPVVFMHHGLWLGIFLAMAAVAAAGLARLAGDGARRGRWLLATAVLFVVLWLAKSLGAFMLAFLFIAVMLLASVRWRLLIAGVFAAVVLLYPMLRGAGLVPVQQVLEFSTNFDAERGASLAYRLLNEDMFLERAAEKPLAGWGGRGRWMIVDERTSLVESVPDGRWVITIAQFGWLGYISEFGLLTLPLLLMAWRGRALGVDMTTSALVLVLAVNVIDLIPNATLTPITWLLAGAVAGRYELGRIGAPEAEPGPRGRRPARKTAAAGGLGSGGLGSGGLSVGGLVRARGGRVLAPAGEAAAGPLVADLGAPDPKRPGGPARPRQAGGA